MLFVRPYPTPADDFSRLAELRRMNVLDTAPEPALDDVVRLACDTFGTEVGLVSLVDDRRQWFKARHGWGGTETDRDCSFCTYAILASEVMVVPDASADPRFSRNPLVTGFPNIRFYAGAPLTSPGGFRLGTLCIIDPRPRSGMTPGERKQLALLAQFTMAELVKRHAADDQRAHARHRSGRTAVISAYRLPPTEASVVNISARGAMIRCPEAELPKGEEVMISMRQVAVVATVAWSRDDMRGLAFHTPLRDDELRTLTGRSRRH